MAVPEQIPVVNYVADGIVKKFDVPFEYDQQSDLHIYVNGVEPTIDKYYFADNAFNFYIAPTIGQDVKIKRITPKERDTDYNLHTNTVRPKALNTDFDRLWYVLQEVFSDVGGLSQAVQDEIIARIQGDEDLLNQLTAEISARMLGDEAVTEDLKNYVNQVIGAIIGDPSFAGIDAKNVNDASGETQQQVNYNGGSKWYSRAGGYKLNERIILTNGDIVKSTTDGNVNNPNADMTGWINESKRELLSLYDFGYKESNTPSENSIVLTNALAGASCKTLLLPENKTIQVGALNATGSYLKLIGSNTTIQFTEEVNNTPIILISSSVDGVKFDGNNLSIGANHETYGAMGFTVVLGAGEFFNATNCVFKNLLGKENNFQYGLSTVASAKTNIAGCIFENIRTMTNTAVTGGFCGGYFIFQPSAIPMSVSQHLVENCLFQDIYTVKNAANQLYDDSDGVRAYFNNYGTGVAGYDTAVKNSVIEVRNCSFINVLKSSCKIQHVKTLIDNCVAIVDDLKDQGQTWVYAGWRYQYGDDITIRNCTVKGSYRFGAYISGDNSIIENLKVRLTDLSAIVTDQAAVQVGRLPAVTPGIIEKCVISGLDCDTKGVHVLGCGDLEIRNSKYTRTVIGVTSDARFINCKLGEIFNNAPLAAYSPSVGKLTYLNCVSSYTGNTLAMTVNSSVVTELNISGCNFTIGACLIFTSYTFSKIRITDSVFTLSTATTATNRRFIQGSASLTELTLNGVTINDARSSTPDILIITNSSTAKTRIQDVTFNGSSSNLYTYLIYAISVAAYPIIRNLTINGCAANARAAAVTNAGAIISGLNCFYTGASILLNQTVGAGQYVVDGMRGTLAATHIETGGVGVVTIHENGTAKW